KKLVIPGRPFRAGPGIHAHRRISPYNRQKPSRDPQRRGNAMSVILGTNGYRYEVSDNWAKLPPGMEFNADVAAVGVDKNDNVYAFNRGKHPMCVFDRDGNFLRSWGEGIF